MAQYAISSFDDALHWLVSSHDSEEAWYNARLDGKLLCIYMFILWFAFYSTK